MIEYTDGRFGTIQKAKDIIDMLHKQPEFDDVKAVHFGTVDKLSQIRQNKMNVDSLADRLSEIERELTSLRPKGIVKVYQVEDIPK